MELKIESSYSNLSKLLQNTAPTSKPAAIPISEKMTAQETGLEQGTKNAQDAVNLAQTADGSLNSVTESLGRIRELAVQASNGVLSADDKSLIQEEINGLKSGINDALRNTEFNTIKLFDGFNGNIQTGANPNQGTEMKIQNTSLETLGIQDFDVTGDFNISDIDSAIESVTTARSELGAQSNSLESNIRYNEIARENTLSSRSNVIDDDFEKSIMQLRQSQLQQQLQFQTQSMRQEQSRNSLNILG